MRRLLIILPLLALAACATSQSPDGRPGLYVRGHPVHRAILNRDHRECLVGEMTIRIEAMYVDSAGVLHLEGRTENAQTGNPTYSIPVVEPESYVRVSGTPDGGFVLRMPRRPGTVLVFRQLAYRSLWVSVDRLFAAARRLPS